MNIFSIIKSSLRKLMLPLVYIDKYIPESGNIYDLGCGEGVIATYLSKNKKRNIIGIDQDSNRIRKSKRKNVNFQKADITKIKIINASGIIISDVLHHIHPKIQKKIIYNAFCGLREGGIFVIKEIDNQEYLRSKMSRFWDFIFYPRDKIFYWKSKELKEYLEKLGFKVKIKRTNRLFPGSTTLFICSK